MEAARFTILLIVIIVLLSWMRGDYNHSLPEVLPFLGGKDTSRIYDGSGLVIIVIILIGLGRLRNRNNSD